MRDLRPLGALCQLFVCFVAQTGSVFPGKYWGNSQGFLLVTAPPKEGGGTSSDRLMGGLRRPPGEPPSWTPDKRCPAPWGRYKQLCWGPGATPAGLPQSAPKSQPNKKTHHDSRKAFTFLQTNVPKGGSSSSSLGTKHLASQRGLWRRAASLNPEAYFGTV